MGGGPCLLNPTTYSPSPRSAPCEAASGSPAGAADRCSRSLPHCRSLAPQTRPHTSTALVKRGLPFVDRDRLSEPRSTGVTGNPARGFAAEGELPAHSRALEAPRPAGPGATTSDGPQAGRHRTSRPTGGVGKAWRVDAKRGGRSQTYPIRPVRARAWDTRLGGRRTPLGGYLQSSRGRPWGWSLLSARFRPSPLLRQGLFGVRAPLHDALPDQRRPLRPVGPTDRRPLA